MAGIADAHYARVLREVARFAAIDRATVKAPVAGGSTFQLTGLGSPSVGDSYKGNFERLTGGGHGEWQSPSFTKLTPFADLADCLKKERGVVRTINAWRWKWHQLRLREEALMWAGLMRLSVAHERWWDRAWGEVVLTEEPGRSFAEPLRVGEQARAIQEFLRVFSSLKAEVSIENVLGVAPSGAQPRALTAADEWIHARSCEVTVKVLGEIPAEPQAAMSVEEVMND